MIKKTVEEEFRFFFLMLSALTFAGAILELWLIEHYESFVQFIPFILSGIGLFLIILMLNSPSKGTIKALRFTSVIIGVGGFYGIYEHMSNNIAFEMEIHSDYTFWMGFWEGLSGATPLLAPGILLFGAILALASTWRHPILR